MSANFNKYQQASININEDQQIDQQIATYINN